MNRSQIKDEIFKIIPWTLSIYEKHPILLTIIKVIVVGLPAIILAYVTIDLDKPLLFQVEIKSILVSHPLWVVGLLSFGLLSSIIITLISHFLLAFRDKYILTTKDLISLLSAIGRVVGEKMKCFGIYAKRMQSATDANEIFNNIAKPEEQIRHLIRNLYLVLRECLNDDIKIVLAKMKDCRPIEWQAYMPPDVHPDIAILDDKKGQSLFSYCAREKREKVITNIAQHLEKPLKQQIYMPSTMPGDDEGSIICYPIIYDHDNKVIFCLSIKTLIPKIITVSFKKKYERIMNEFIKRIQLEYSLVLIKNKVI